MVRRATVVILAPKRQSHRLFMPSPRAAAVVVSVLVDGTAWAANHPVRAGATGDGGWARGAFEFGLLMQATTTTNLRLVP
jgi:hypothetical protein